MDPVVIDIVTALPSAITAINEQVGGALPLALGIGGTLLAAGIAWKLFKRFVRG